MDVERKEKWPGFPGTFFEASCETWALLLGTAWCSAWQGPYFTARLSSWQLVTSQWWSQHCPLIPGSCCPKLLLWAECEWAHSLAGSTPEMMVPKTCWMYFWAFCRKLDLIVFIITQWEILIITGSQAKRDKVMSSGHRAAGWGWIGTKWSCLVLELACAKPVQWHSFLKMAYGFFSDIPCEFTFPCSLVYYCAKHSVVFIILTSVLGIES